MFVKFPYPIVIDLRQRHGRGRIARLDSNQRAGFFGVANPSGLAPPLDPQLNTPGWTRTSDPGIRKFRRDDFASREETTKSVVRRCRQTASESMSGFATIVSFTAQRSEKGTSLRNPQIHVGGYGPGMLDSFPVARHELHRKTG